MKCRANSCDLFSGNASNPYSKVGKHLDVQVEINVLDSNDNQPQFGAVNASYSVTVREDVPPGTVLLTLSASDADVGANGQVQFSLADRSSRDSAAKFEVRPTTGEIVTVGALDHEQQPLHRLYVVASDKPEAKEPLSSIATVEVRVADVNDHAPRIRVNDATGNGNGNNTTLTVERGAPGGSFVGHVTVDDADGDENGRFRCRLAGPHAAKFRLHRMYRTEFKIVTAAAYDREDYEDVVEFSIACRDDGVPSLTSSLPVHIFHHVVRCGNIIETRQSQKTPRCQQNATTSCLRKLSPV